MQGRTSWRGEPVVPDMVVTATLAVDSAMVVWGCERAVCGVIGQGSALGEAFVG